MDRRSVFLTLVLVVAVATGLVGCTVVPPASAPQAFPSRTIEIVTAFNPGGMSDIVARAIASTMPDSIGQTAVVLNKPGAAGMDAVQYVAESSSEGYTMGAFSVTHFLPESARNDSPYQGSDLRPVCSTHASILAVFVSSDAPWQTLQEFVDWARTQPTVNMAHSGRGSTGHQVVVSLAKVAGLNVTDVPFAGDATVVTAVLGGTVPVAATSYSALTQHVAAGTIRILGVTSEQRIQTDEGKDIPTLAEAGFELPIKFLPTGLFVPAETPDDIVAKLDEAVKASLEHSTTAAILRNADVIVDYRPHDQFTADIAAQREPIISLMKELGIIE